MWQSVWASVCPYMGVCVHVSVCVYACVCLWVSVCVSAFDERQKTAHVQQSLSFSVSLFHFFISVQFCLCSWKKLKACRQNISCAPFFKTKFKHLRVSVVSFKVIYWDNNKSFSCVVAAVITLVWASVDTFWACTVSRWYRIGPLCIGVFVSDSSLYSVCVLSRLQKRKT